MWLMLAAALAAEPPPPPPAERIVYSAILGARYNSLGLALPVDVGYQRRLYKSDGILFEDAWVRPELHAVVTPAYFWVGPGLQVQPLAVLKLSAHYLVGHTFGLFNVHSFPTAQADVSDSAISELGAANAYATPNRILKLGARLQGKVGPIAARSSMIAWKEWIDLKAGEPYFYSSPFDVLMKDGGWLIENDLDLLYLHGDLAVGARWTLTDALIADRPGEAQHKVGPMLAWTHHKRPGTAFSAGTVVVMSQWWLAHPYRTGVDTSQWIPSLLGAYIVDGDLWKRGSRDAP